MASALAEDTETQKNTRRVSRAVLRRAFLTLAGLAFVGTMAIAGAAAYGYWRHNQVVTLPAPAGPYAVGRVESDWVDASRAETFGSDPNARRELVVWIWYPAASGATTAAAPYLPDSWRLAMERVRGGLGVLVTQSLAAVRDHAVADAPLAAARQPFPVIVMQPGLGPIAPDYTTLAEDLASRGYVVIASTPTYSANAVAFPDGRVVERTDAGTVPDSAPPDVAKSMLDRLAGVWAADDRFVMDQAQKLNTTDPSGRFTGKLDLNAIGVMGHSFGGASAAQTCHLDDRCKAGADLDGWPYGDVIQNGLRQPFLFMWSVPASLQKDGLQQAERDTQALVNHSTGKTYQLTVEDTRHFNFSDYAVLYEPLLKPMQMLGSIDGRRGLKITTEYLAAFFDHTLRGAPATLLAGPSPEYPEVEFKAP
jgi:predicted dienelactone hydrolase